MADLISSIKTSLTQDDAVARTIQFFTKKGWHPHTQSQKKIVFTGRPPFPIISFILFLLTAPTIIGPIIFGLRIISKVGTKWHPKSSVLTITINPTSECTELNVEYPPHAKSKVNEFLEILPTL